MKLYILLLGLLIANNTIAQEPYEGNQTYTYLELHKAYADLAKKHPTKCKLFQFGTGDNGMNIELFLINKDGNFQSGQFGNKSVLMVNNAIHPGEPCGVDACVKLTKELLSDEINLPDNVVIGIIPMYNVGGGLNRNCCSRANQNGPEEYGFRGNAKNLDLNRDFVKADARNTRVFYKIYQFLKPNIFVDTHTSNGADYQHIMTLITSQVDKMNPYLRTYTTERLNPYLFSGMKSEGYDMVPYVHSIKSTPDNGIKGYLETGRYSTGYTNMFNTIGYVTEAHMLKTFEERVIATYVLLKIMIEYMNINASTLNQYKRLADFSIGQKKYIPINWELDTGKFEWLDFKGYEAQYINSSVTGTDRLFYNPEKPYEKQIKYYNHYMVVDSVQKPNYYILSQAWQDVIIRLQLNGVSVQRLTRNKVLEVEVYYIEDYQTVATPYEGHYLHRNINVSKVSRQLTFYQGDYLIPTANPNAQFIVQTLEPHAVDSYFSWNYFDPILQQKEWFSPYIFEETAEQMLAEDPILKEVFNKKKEMDEDFANDAFSQLYFLYKKSPNYERTHNRYPVVRYLNDFEKEEIELAPKLIGG